MMAQVYVAGQEGFRDVNLFLSVQDDALSQTRTACSHSGLSSRQCSDLLKDVVSLMKSYVEEEGAHSPSVNELLTGHSTNAILLRNEGADRLSAEVKAAIDSPANHGANEDEAKPLKIFFHLDQTNNLGDKWTIYIFLHYAHNMGFRGKIEPAKNKTDTFVTAVGSTLQWLFKERADRVEISHQGPDILLAHDTSGLRTSIGNGLISADGEDYVHDDPHVIIAGVRGPLTREILSRAINRAPPVISDPGLLAPRMFPLTRPSASLRRPVGFVVHEAHREVFGKVFPQFQDLLVDNHVTLNARAFMEQLLSYEVIVSSSLHGIVFAHAYGINVLPVSFHLDVSGRSERKDVIVGGDFKYRDYYQSVGHTAFARRVPLLDTTFGPGTTTEEIVHRLGVMARKHWQPDAKKISELQGMQEALIMDYLRLYHQGHDLAFQASGRSGECRGIDDMGVLAEDTNGVASFELKFMQKYFLMHALAELYPHVPCPSLCLEQMNVSAPLAHEEPSSHPSAMSMVNGLTIKVVFPRTLIERVRGIAESLGKSLDYNFIGLCAPHREWVYAFDSNEHAHRTSVVRPSFRGRSPHTYLFDYEYFNILATSRFTLCPVGENRWSFRFLEAIMAMSIPILSTADPLDMHAETEGFFYYTYTPPSLTGNDDTYQREHNAQVRNFVYSSEKAESNYERLIANHLIGEEIGGALRESTKCEGYE